MTQLQDLSTALAGLVASSAPSVIAVQSHRSRSSGFVWRPGLIVTADEALSEDGEYTVTLSGGDTVPAQLVGRDPTTDVALLRVDRSDPRPVPLEAAPVPVGALVIAMGAENGAPTAALGVVSRSEGLWRSLRGGEIDARIELDLRLRRSAEGGLAVDPVGRAIGMTVFGPRRRVLVIPSATIARVAARLESHGRIPRGYLGLGLRLVALEGGRLGAMVMTSTLKDQEPRRASTRATSSSTGTASRSGMYNLFCTPSDRIASARRSRSGCAEPVRPSRFR